MAKNKQKQRITRIRNVQMERMIPGNGAESGVVVMYDLDSGMAEVTVDGTVVVPLQGADTVLTQLGQLNNPRRIEKAINRLRKQAARIRDKFNAKHGG